MAPFGLFKRKPSDIPPPEHSIPIPTTDRLSIHQAQDLLASLETAKVKDLSTSLTLVKESAVQSLQAIDTLAKDMDKENIKLEGLELRLKSVVEHSKRTVISSLKREASSELPSTQTANDAKKFKERFENMMKRFGEVSGSHSKVLNAFMKKHSSKMREEFDKLSKLLKETQEVIADFDRNQEPVNRCQSMLNTALQKVSSIKAAESSAKKIENEIGNMESELQRLETELKAVNRSQEFAQASTILRKRAEAEKKQEELHAKIKDLFSHLSRAFTKYSYGITKETEQRLKTMSEEPWKIFYERSISSYSSLLQEIQKSVLNGQIQLKDSEKVLQYIDTILESLPDLQHRAERIDSEIDSFKEVDIQVVNRVKSLEHQIVQQTDELARSRKELEQQRQRAMERTEEVNYILNQASEILVELIGRKYHITYYDD